MNFPTIFTKKLVVVGVTILAVVILALLVFSKLAPYIFTDSDKSGSQLVVKHITPRREQSLEDWRSRNFGDETASEYGQARTCLILVGKPSLKIEPIPVDGEPGVAGPKFSWNADKGGTATAITGDGYWLTATHVIDSAPDSIKLLALNEEKYPHLHPVRLVWSNPSDETSDPDIALIHTTYRAAKHFALPRPGKYTEGGEVLAVGFGGGGATLGLAGGQLSNRGP